MSGETLIVVLPLISLILASLSIAGLWYWWTSGKQAEDDQDNASQSGMSHMSSTTVASFGEASVEDAESDIEGKSLVEMFDGAMDFLDTQLSKLLSSRIESQIEVQSSEPLPTSQQPPPPPMPPTPVPSAAQPLPSAASPSTPGQSVEAMRVLRDLADGSLIIEVDGRQYRNASQITDPDIYRRLSGNLQALMSFLMEKNAPQPNNYSPTSISPPPMVPSVPQSQPSRSATTGKEDQDESSQPDTMGGQIESLLQYRLTLTPSMAARSIHIRDAGDGVAIEVDGRYYDSIAEVPDLEIREFIQNVIREWEARQ